MRCPPAFVALAMCGCSGAEPAAEDLVAKCSFGDAVSGAIEPGDAFVYVLFDAGEGTYAVVSGVADVREPLIDRSTLNVGPRYPAWLAGTRRLEWGEEDSLGFGHYLGLSPPTGAVSVTSGTTYGLSERVYPYCMFW
jgi:hypothetical protein